MHALYSADAFSVAAAWMSAQPRRAKQRHHWPRLLRAVAWDEADCAGLNSIWKHPDASNIPGLQELLIKALLRLCAKLER